MTTGNRETGMLINLIVVIIYKSKCISNNHVYLKLQYLIVSYISEKLEEKKNSLEARRT